MSCDDYSVAVMMTAYNAEKFLEAAVNSVLNQTHRNWRLLICDDASQDATWQLMQRFASQDARITLLRNERNLGVPKTRNRILRAVPEDAQFIAVLDSDDIAMPERLSVQLRFLEAHPEIDAVGSSIGIIDEDDVLYAHRRYPSPSPAAMPKYALCSNPLAHSTFCFRREILQDLTGYDESYKSCEDYELVMRLLTVHRLAILPEELVHYRISRSQWKQRHLKATLRATLSIQRRYLFRRGFASLRGQLSWLGKHLLYLLPNRAVMYLFQRVTYQSRV